MSGIETKKSRPPWFWIPTLYVAEGLPYTLVINVTVVLYSTLGVSNTATAFWTSLLYLPWVIKPIWSPLVDLIKTRRTWIWTMQLFAGAGFAAVALMIPVPHFAQWTIILFGLLAFNAATHDIAADGFYMLATTEHDQSFFIGFRSVFFNVGKVLAQGGLVYVAGELQKSTGSITLAWSVTFLIAAGIFLCLGLYHHFILPKPDSDKPKVIRHSVHFWAEFFKTFGAFFQRPKILTLLTFILLYRLGEAQLVKMTQPFLLDPQNTGGLGLGLKEVSIVYGTVGFIAFIFGALLGGFFIARKGLKFWLWPMLLAIHLPDAVFIWLAYEQPQNLFAVGTGLAIEQFGYGFGFTALSLYMIYIARGEHATAHYAIATGFMALGMMLPGMVSGKLQELLGYQHFFIWVILATIPSFIVAMKIPLDAEFGKRNQQPEEKTVV
ncbi:MAG TPA: MFS transporter [Verrucomicrobiae bacterium]|nr:MFS transporter [Verrucomicrobiae bacterium]